MPRVPHMVRVGAAAVTRLCNTWGRLPCACGASDRSACTCGDLRCPGCEACRAADARRHREALAYWYSPEMQRKRDAAASKQRSRKAAAKDQGRLL